MEISLSDVNWITVVYKQKYEETVKHVVLFS